jgi:hypothetical protein
MTRHLPKYFIVERDILIDPFIVYSIGFLDFLANPPKIKKRTAGNLSAFLCRRFFHHHWLALELGHNLLETAADIFEEAILLTWKFPTSSIQSKYIIRRTRKEIC